MSVRATMLAAARVGAVAALVAAGSAGAKLTPSHTTTSRYSGHTSQGWAVHLAVDGRKVTFKVGFRQSCLSPANKFIGQTTGSFHFGRRPSVRTDARSRFSLRFVQGQTRASRFAEYFTAVYTVTGTVGKKSSSGTLSAVSKYYTLRGAPIGTCRTGVLGWSAKRKH